jgi:hypothetical protein
LPSDLLSKSTTGRFSFDKPLTNLARMISPLRMDLYIFAIKQNIFKFWFTIQWNLVSEVLRGWVVADTTG